MGKQSLVSLDTLHIHGYVFETNRLQEIRGASSILDTLNRKTMEDTAGQFNGKKVYANGGSGLFLIEGDPEKFAQRVQQAYREKTRGGASIAYAIQELPDGIDPWEADTGLERDLLNYKLMQNKNEAPAITSLLSQPLLRPCSACGTRYAEHLDLPEINDPASRDNRYCGVCREKREEDDDIKGSIYDFADEYRRTGSVKYDVPHVTHGYAWARMIDGLGKVEEEGQSKKKYEIPEGTERPPDFNELRGIKGGKDYLALIYADGNGMGQVFAGLKKLRNVQERAEAIDNAIYTAMSAAVSRHLQVVESNDKIPPRFPFDMLLMGGDDAIIVTPAPQALDVACTLAKTFHEETSGLGDDGKGLTLSIGIVFAPVSYPFGLLYDLAHDALRHAKKEGDKREHVQSAYGKSYINFMSVTGSTSLSFQKVYKSLHDKHAQDGGREVAMYATLRPYSVEELEDLLKAIRRGRGMGLGRTKLHQVREAVLEKNLTTSVYESMAVLRNWRPKQREFVLQEVYKLGNRYQEAHREPDKPGSIFPRVTFPWFADGPDTYRTSLLDFVELYDFVAQKETEIEIEQEETEVGA